MSNSKINDWLKYGVSVALDLPTEGVTPSNYPQAGTGSRAEQVAPNNATPVIDGGGIGIGGFSPMWIVAGIGILAVAKALKVI